MKEYYGPRRSGVNNPNNSSPVVLILDCKGHAKSAKVGVRDFSLVTALTTVSRIEILVGFTKTLEIWVFKLAEREDSLCVKSSLTEKNLRN